MMVCDVYGTATIGTLIVNKGILIPRDTIRRILALHAPEGLDKRFPGINRIKRSSLSALGPGHQYHADGHEKLNAQALGMGGVGITIYGIKDQWSSFIIHLVAVPNNRLADTIGHVYLDAIEKEKLIPITMVVDKGSEIGEMFAHLTGLRTVYTDFDVDKYPPMIQIRSVHNTPIEGLWHWFLKTYGLNIKDVIVNGYRDGFYNPNNPVHPLLFYWLWPKVVQEQLDTFTEFWNTHRIRTQKEKPNMSGSTPKHAFIAPKAPAEKASLIPQWSICQLWLQGGCSLLMGSTLTFGRIGPRGAFVRSHKYATRFINLATQSPNKLQVGHSIQSCTDAVERADPFDLDGRRIILFDTPGFDDTNKSETEILRIIAFELEKQYRKGQTLHGIIYIHRISDLRVGGLAKTNFSIFRKLCGDPSLQNVIIVTNMWSRLPSAEEGRRRAVELASLDDFFKPAIAQGAMMMHHYKDTVDSAHRILRQILKNHPMALSIQKELVDQHKNITETGAGMALDEKLTLLAQEYERKLKEQFEAAEEARRERDEETRKEQLEEAERSKFNEPQRKREQAIRGAEERRREATQAVAARWRQHVEAAERRRALKDINETGSGMTADEKPADFVHQYELSKAQIEATRQKQLEEAERVRQLLEKSEEEKRDQARQYQSLQEQFAEAERKREQAEERSRNEFQAAEASWRQEKADLEERIRDTAIPLDFPGFRHGCIVSGRSYAMFNKRHNSYYATVHEETEHLIMESRLSDESRARQQWIFKSHSNRGDMTLWTIQSASNGNYLCAEGPASGLKACEASSPSLWRTSKVSGRQFRIHLDNGSPDYGERLVLAVSEGHASSGDMIDMFSQLDDHRENDT
ncbi:hypothetical protein H1R20_g1278, partial [Candolleomyces eurysporus]